MNDRAAIERRLATLADEIVWPEPDEGLPRRVTTRLASPRPRRILPRPVVAVAALILLVAVALALPGPRRAIADLFGAAGIQIGVAGGGESFEKPGAIELGSESSFEAIGGRLDFSIRVPVGMSPDRVFLGDNGEVTMAWHGDDTLPAAGESGIAMLLTQRRAAATGSVGEKTLRDPTQAMPIAVDAVEGIWIEGAPHLITWRDSQGRLVEETTRLAANVLLWTDDGVDHRLETTGDLQQALAVAESLQPVR